MSRERLRTVGRRALAVYGASAQAWQAVEELAELIVALNRWRRGRLSRAEVLDEVVDVRIMLAQVEIMLEVTPDEVDEAVARKLRHVVEPRLLEHLRGLRCRRHALR